jgi:O-antigen/teichoic acid export membrane protein
MFEKLNLLIPFGNFIRNKSFQNFLFFAVIQSSNVLISIISMPLLIQSIGVDQFGLVNLSLSIIVLLNILVGFGYNLSAPREIAINQGNKEALSHVVSKVFSGKVLLAFFATFLVLIGSFVFNLFQEYRMILVFSVLLLFSEATLPLWVFQGMEKMKLVSIANIFSKLLFLMGIVLFIHSPEQSKWVNFLMGFFGLGTNLFLLAYIHSFLGIQFYRPEFSAIWKSLMDNSLLFFSNLASYISISGGLIVLSFFANAETLGMYSLAERVIMVVRLFPSFIFQAIIPNASRLYSENLPAFFVFMKSVFKKVLLVGMIISVVIYFAAPFIVQVLSRSVLEDSVLYLKILAFVPFLACLNVANVTMMMAADLRQLLFKASWLMCAFMLILSPILTSYFGPIGLCIAIISTEIVVLLICMVLLYRHNKILFYGFYS